VLILAGPITTFPVGREGNKSYSGEGDLEGRIADVVEGMIADVVEGMIAEVVEGMIADVEGIVAGGLVEKDLF